MADFQTTDFHEFFMRTMSHQVYRKNELLCCSHIPGPSHNWLGLRLVADSVVDTVITRLERRPHSTDLNEDMIALAVKRGADAENGESGTRWHIADIVYVADDSPRYYVYEMLSRKIVSAMNSGEIAGESKHQLTRDLYDGDDG